MGYEEAINLWASRKYNLKDVTKVSFDIEATMGGYCETCEYPDASIEVRVTHGGKVTYYPEDKYGLGELVQEIVEVSNADN